MHRLTVREARGEMERLLREFWTRSYEAYKRGEDFQEQFLETYAISRQAYQQTPSRYPPRVREAYAYYLTGVENADWGVVRLYRLPVGPHRIWVVRVTTDGDDGWLELYGARGRALGVGRTYIELVGWGHRAPIRAQVENGEFPPSLSDRDTRTLWGK